MLKVTLENAKGEQLLITNEARFSVAPITGLNPPAASLIYTDNIGDGSQFQHQRTPRRNIVINMVINGDVESNRLDLYNYVQTGQYIKVYIETYQRNVWIEGRVETCEVDPFERKTTCQISIICNEPYFKDLEQSMNMINTVKGMLYFPYYTITPQPVSLYKRIQILNLLNEGNVASGMTIEMTAKGVVTNPIIYNRETKEFIGLGSEQKPYELQPGDKVIIKTYDNNKTVTLIRDATETNIFNYLTPNSKFIQVGVGDNVFTYSADDGDQYLNITFTYYQQYKGI